MSLVAHFKIKSSAPLPVLVLTPSLCLSLSSLFVVEMKSLNYNSCKIKTANYIFSTFNDIEYTQSFQKGGMGA